MATLPLILLGVVGIYLSLLPAILLSANGEDGPWVIVGLVVGFLSAMGLFVVLMAAVSGPLNASLYRAVSAHIETGAPLTVGAAFSSVKVDLGKVLAVVALQLIGTLVAATCCYFPALIAAAALHLAFPAVVLRGSGPVEAIRGSAGVFRANPLHHLKAWGLGMVMLVVVANIPFVGGLISMPLYAAYQIRYFKACFPGR